MNKLEAGMYIRFKDKNNYTYIQKIINYKEHWCGCKVDENATYALYISDKNIINYSFNIVDLIEVGDIVITPLGEIIQLYVDNIDELKDYWKITNNPIKSIVTKEQFESMKYEVE